LMNTTTGLLHAHGSWEGHHTPDTTSDKFFTL
jgi:hypothetical protein